MFPDEHDIHGFYKKLGVNHDADQLTIEDAYVELKAPLPYSIRAIPILLREIEKKTLAESKKFISDFSERIRNDSRFHILLKNTLTDLIKQKPTDSKTENSLAPLQTLPPDSEKIEFEYIQTKFKQLQQQLNEELETINEIHRRVVLPSGREKYTAANRKLNLFASLFFKTARQKTILDAAAHITTFLVSVPQCKT